ncbi:four-carbon acid sugar kinase family protein [Acidisoma sp. 7E03]
MDGGVMDAGGRWLILADDLTGACDCAVAFATRGRRASVTWGGETAAPVMAVDMDSRRLSAASARTRMRAQLERRPPGDRNLYKKVDSTWRGQPAAEIAAILGQLRDGGEEALAIVAPAFPAAGRTQRAGRLWLHGRPLEESALWQADHASPDADLGRILRAEGLGVALLPRQADTAALRHTMRSGVEVLLCDAETQEDLDGIAAAALTRDRRILWVGSAGLAHALAQLGASDAAPPRQPRPGAGGFLFVVGSIAGASRSAAAVLAADPTVETVTLTPAALRSGGAAPAGDQVAEILRQGRDVLVTIGEEASPDLGEGATLAQALAACLAPAAAGIGALFLTGGETARAVLTVLGVGGIRLVGEIEPGVPWGETEGALRRPVITKAGGFGTAETLRRCLDHLRDLRRQEENDDVSR